MSKSDPASAKNERRKTIRWVITIFFVTIVISAIISFVSSEIMEISTVPVMFVILFLIVLVGITFDVIGVAVTSADEKPFHSMAARKVPGAHESIRLLRNAERVSSICNDVIGDICGVVSGAASAAIATTIIGGSRDLTRNEIISLAMSALVAALTVGGKAVGKTFAVNSCTVIVHFTGKVIWGIRQFPKLFQKRK